MHRAIAGMVCLLLASACGDSGLPAEKVDGKTVSGWKKELESHDAGKRAAAYLALARFADPPLDLIAQGLGDKRTRGRLGAIEAIGSLGEAAGEHAKALAALVEEDPKGFSTKQVRELRIGAMTALGKMGRTGFKAVAHLIVSRDAGMRERAAYTIRPLLGTLDDPVDTLTRLIEDSSWKVRLQAVLGLGQWGKKNRRASTLLLEALEDEEARVAREAAIALGGIGGRADHEGQALADRLYDHNAGMRASAVYGLGLMGEEASPYLKSVADLATNDAKRVVRIQAALSHWRIGGKTEIALPELSSGLECGDKGLCRDALKAIAAIGPPAAGAVSTVLPLLDDPALRRYAVAALAAIGPAASAALPKLEAIVESAGDKTLKEEAAKAVEAIKSA